MAGFFMDDQIKSAIAVHALTEYPRECCGLVVKPVATACPALPAPPAWAMVPPPMQTSTQRLRNAFSTPPATISARSTN